MSRSPHIRFVAALCALALLIAVVPSAAFAAPTFHIRGTGFGHGIGMSQYGAQGSALAGKDYRWILAHYYTGATLTTLSSSRIVRVNLDPAFNPTTNAGYTAATWNIAPGQSGATLSINGVNQVAGTYRFTASGSNVIVVAPGGATQTLAGAVTVAPVGGSPALLQVVEGTGIYDLPNSKYRGTFSISASAGKLKLLNLVPIDAYCYGVVPRESPSGWRPEALKAQAVAARSYAYASSGDLYSTTMSQAYQGYGAYNSSGVWVGEMASTNAAVDATALQVLSYGGNVIRAYFFSTSGGYTANNEDVWTAGAPLPWARAVADPYEHLAAPAYAPWPASKEKTFSAVALADLLRSAGIAGVPASPAYVTRMVPERVASGHVKYVTFQFSTGASVRITGDKGRSVMGLLSTVYYSLGFPITRIQGPTRYDTAGAVAARAFPATAPSVVIASGEDYPDALAGSGVAGAVDGPLLLTPRTGLAEVTVSELRRLNPTSVYIMGSEAAVTKSVSDAIAQILPGATIVRFGGRDRYETARIAAEFVQATTGATSAILVSGTAWADAASASQMAYSQGWPILLTPPTTLGSDAAAYLAAKRPTTAYIVGGPPAVAAPVEVAARTASGGAVQRLEGPDRYNTSAAVAEWCIANAGFTASRAYLATGGAFPDALTGGILAAVDKKPLCLTQPSDCRSGTATFLSSHKATLQEIVVLGGPGAISNAGLEAIDTVMSR